MIWLVTAVGGGKRGSEHNYNYAKRGTRRAQGAGCRAPKRKGWRRRKMGLESARHIVNGTRRAERR